MPERAIDTVLVAYNSDEVIRRALRLAAELGGRAVVVDHGDGHSAVIAAGSGAIALHNPANPGFGTGQNQGMSFTESEFVLLCNPDAEIVPAAVRAGAQLLQSRPDVAAVQGVIVNDMTGQPERSAGVEVGPVHLVGRAIGAKALLRRPWFLALARRSSTLHDHVDRVPGAPVEVDSLAATAILVRRSAFAAVRGFDEAFFLYGEDLDLCSRLRAAGWQLLSMPQVFAVHASGGSADSSWSREANWWRGTLQFGAPRWSGPAWTVALFAATMRWARLALRSPRYAPPAFRAMVLDPVRMRRARTHQQLTPVTGPATHASPAVAQSARAVEPFAQTGRVRFRRARYRAACGDSVAAQR